MVNRIFRNRRILIPSICGLIILFGFFVLPLILSNIEEEQVLGVKLLSFSQIELPDTTCYIKTTGTAQKGSLQNTQQSKMLTKHPRTSFGEPLSLVDNQGVKDIISEFKLDSKIRCDTVEPVKGITPTFVVDQVTLKYQVLSQNKKLDKVTTYTKEFKTTNDISLSDNKEVIMNSIKINANDIESNLPEKEYNSYHEFQTSGKVVIYYKGFPNTKYVIDIPSDAIRVYYSTFITSFPEDVPRPNTCPTGEILVDGVCTPKDLPPDTCDDTASCGKPPEKKSDGDSQPDPKVVTIDEILKNFTSWFNALIIGDFATLQQTKYLLFNALLGLVILVGLVNLFKPKKKILS